MKLYYMQFWRLMGQKFKPNIGLNKQKSVIPRTHFDLERRLLLCRCRLGLGEDEEEEDEDERELEEPEWLEAEELEPLEEPELEPELLLELELDLTGATAKGRR